jgi:hypothetical protein
MVVLYQKQLALVDQFVIFESRFYILFHLFPYSEIVKSIHFFKLLFFPAFIFRLKFAQYKNKFVQYACGERAGAAGEVDNLAIVNRLYQAGNLLLISMTPLGVVGEKLLQQVIYR